ncbi:hypothetical protein AB0F96_07900 [Streptomyces sp. NPDC023998]|uniref:hypothetical protein n=1 Tax=Streptomyces sp. NPDC023998 TaxID=3154597 RepID=UPI0033FDE594
MDTGAAVHHLQTYERVWRDFDLINEAQPTKANGAPGRLDPSGQTAGIRLGLPFCRDLTPDSVDDPELSRFIAAHPQSTYSTVQLACTFTPDADDEYTRATLQVFLSRADDQNTPPLPVAYSMSPRRQVDTGTPVTFTLTASVLFVEAAVEMTRPLRRDKVFLQAMNIKLPDPGWEFRRTPKSRIDGPHDLALVTVAPTNVPVHGRLAVNAEVRRKGMPGWFRTRPEDAAALTFTITG